MVLLFREANEVTHSIADDVSDDRSDDVFTLRPANAVKASKKGLLDHELSMVSKEYFSTPRIPSGLAAEACRCALLILLESQANTTGNISFISANLIQNIGFDVNTRRQEEVTRKHEEPSQWLSTSFPIHSFGYIVLTMTLCVRPASPLLHAICADCFARALLHHMLRATATPTHALHIAIVTLVGAYREVQRSRTTCGISATAHLVVVDRFDVEAPA